MSIANLQIHGNYSSCEFSKEEFAAINKKALVNHELMYVNLTHTRVDLFSLGNRMATLLIERINNSGNPQPNREIRFDCPIVIGNSTAAPKE